MIDLEQRINSTPRNILIARVKAREIYHQNLHDAKAQKHDGEILDFVTGTPGETFGEIRKNIEENPAYRSPLKQFALKASALFSQVEPEPCLKSKPAKFLDDLTDSALGVPLLESALKNIQANPESSEAQFHIALLKGGGDRALEGISGGTPEYAAYKDVFPVVNEWLIAQ